MKFEEALAELRKGNKGIASANFSIKLSDLGEISTLFKTGSNFGDAANEIVNGNWELLEEPGKSFPEVLEGFKEGKKIRRKSWPDHSWISKHEIRNNYIKNSLFNDFLEKDWEIIE